MSRIFKFRGWDKELKRMVDGLYLHTQMANGLTIYFQKQFKIMQYTGLKDKNGKEIYEGDIIQEYKIIIPILIHKGDTPREKVITEVKWDINCFNIPRMSWFVEIIGNIYENPELITE